ncbi:MAG: cytochrome c3 family protein [Deltaproteobacteria bacterium]|nr:cytochrome c3 family protein [Deltaproteobacteria bacterium]
MARGLKGAIGAWVILGAIFAPAELRAQERGCADQGCHATVLLQVHKHTALEDGDCTDCHDGNEDASARCGSGLVFERHEDPDVCLGCHDDPRIEGKTHAALLDGCMNCHGPHGGENAFNLEKSTVQDICAKCHDPFEGDSTHKPVDEGRCTGCHNPHASEFAPLLRASRKELCYTCHEVSTLRPTSESGYVVKHYPVEGGGCLSCHKPHTADEKPLLRETGNILCLNCHAANKTSAETSLKGIRNDAEVVHEALEAGTCSNCHGPHGAGQPALLKKKRPELCYECHDEIERTFLHSAVRTGRCNECHDPHGEDRETLLKADGSGLCFRCHEDDLTGRPFQHAPAEAGACMACHDPHGAKNPMLLSRGEGQETCLSCHGAEGESKLKFAFEGQKHAAIDRFGCTICHDPHGGDNPKLAPKEPNSVCIGCHEKQKSGSHIFTSFSGQPHPVKGPRDPQRPGQALGCVSCHQPHGSPYPNLWWGGERRDAMCKRCHQGGRVLYLNPEVDEDPKAPGGEIVTASRDEKKKDGGAGKADAKKAPAKKTDEKKGEPAASKTKPGGTPLSSR